MSTAKVKLIYLQDFILNEIFTCIVEEQCFILLKWKKLQCFPWISE